MATFTMNSQKTFVQSSDVKNGLDKAFIFSVLLIVLVGGLWGAERALIYFTEKQTEKYHEQATAQLNAINPEEVQSAHDITSRIAAVKQQQAAKPDLGQIFGALERTTIPQVRLTSFGYASDGAMTIEGVASEYRFLAEQLLRYRQESLFASSELASSSRSDSGQISFSLTVEPAQKAEAAVTAQPINAL